MKGTLRILTSDVVSGWNTLRQCANHTSAIEKRVWCYNGVHLVACVRVEAKPMTEGKREYGPNPATYVCSADGGKGEIERTPCNCGDDICPKYCAEIGEIPRGFAPNAVLEYFGLARKLEKDEILVFQRLVYSSDWSHKYDVDVYREGAVITENHLRGGYLLRPGESVVLEVSVRGGNGYYIVKTLYSNKNGTLAQEDGAKDEKKAFAKKQAELLIQAGFNREDAWRIIRKAGPGSAVTSLRFLERIIGKCKYSERALKMILENAKDQNGWHDGKAILDDFGFDLPEVRNSGQFFFYNQRSD